MSEIPGYLNLIETAERLGIGSHTNLYRWIQIGLLKTYRIGSRGRLVKEDELNELITHYRECGKSYAKLVAWYQHQQKEATQ